MTIKEIKKDLNRKLKDSIGEVAYNAKKIMSEELEDFYSGDVPKIYHRTGTLGTTPQITDKYCTSNSAGVTASLNENINYNTGSFSGSQVINAAELGNAGIVGKSGFWLRSDARIKDMVDNIILKNF